MTSILVADDAPSVRTLIRLILGPGYDVIEAVDGDHALRQVIDRRPDIAILDVTMPGQTGIEVCQQIRQDPSLAATGIVVMTANGTPQDRTAALGAGADYFVTKPFSPSAIVRLVESLLARRDSMFAGS